MKTLAELEINYRVKVAEAYEAGYQAAKDQLQPFHAGADVYIIDANNPLPKPMPLTIAEQNQFADTCKVMNSSNNLNGWISVKDRLPEVEEYVVILWNDMPQISYLTVWEHFAIGAGGITPEPSHWMPLPPPPTE